MTLYEVGFEYFAGVTVKFVFRDEVLCSLVEEPHIPEDSWLHDISRILKWIKIT